MGIRVSLGQDSHRFREDGAGKCVLGGILFEDAPPFDANSDGDVVVHAITNAISGITCRNILGEVADRMCRDGITDSSMYLKTALADLHDMGYYASHVSISIEASRPKISPKADRMRSSVAAMLGMDATSVGITATTGEGLTAVGKGMGVSVLCILTAQKKDGVAPL